MKKWLIRRCYDLGWRRLAYRISPSLCWGYIGEKFARSCQQSIAAMSSLTTTMTEALQSQEVQE